MKMFFYVAEDLRVEGATYANHLIKRCDTHEEAVRICKIAVEDWQNSGYEAQLTWVDGEEVWGARALDENCMVKHMYHIFVSPIFMAGGNEGL